MEERPLDGIGGWLILPLLALIFESISRLLLLVEDLNDLFAGGLWEHMTVAGKGLYHEHWPTILAFELTASAVVICMFVLCLIYFFRRSQRTPHLVIALLALNLLFAGLDYAVTSHYGLIELVNAVHTASELRQAIVWAAIWIPYFLVSKRVKSTFVE